MQQKWNHSLFNWKWYKLKKTGEIEIIVGFDSRNDFIKVLMAQKNLENVCKTKFKKEEMFWGFHHLHYTISLKEHLEESLCVTLCEGPDGKTQLDLQAVH